MTKFKHYRSGKLYGIQYHFEATGDGLPPHEHGTELAHNIVVMRGSVRLQVSGEPVRDLMAGEICDFDWAKRHTLHALEPDSVVLHCLLNGMPPDYETLPSSELQGAFSLAEILH